MSDFQDEYKIVRILATSDTHDLHHKIDIDQLPQADIFIHTGDFTKDSKKAQFQRFRQFVQQLPYKHKVVISGNHDFVLNKQKYQYMIKTTNHKYKFQEIDPQQQIQKLKGCCTYLQHQMVQIQGVRIFGTNFQFYQWAFIHNQNQKQQFIKKIPLNIDVLLTHKPPYGILDRTYSKQNSGCKGLLKFVNNIKPKIHIFGHIHQAYGLTQIGDTHFYNASLVNANYKVANQMHLIQIKVKLPRQQQIYQNNSQIIN